MGRKDQQRITAPGSGWRCRAEDNCERGRKDQQRITVEVVNGDVVQRTTAGVLVN